MSSPFKVLLIEDDVADIDLTQEAFLDSKLHVSLSAVRSGAEALAYLNQRSPFEDAVLPDLIFLDLNLPGMSGKEILHAIRGEATLCHIPVAILTTSQAQQDVDDSYRLGANCYVSKPVGLDEFTQTIHALEEFWFTVVKIPPRKQ